MNSPKCEIKKNKLDFPPANNMIPKNFDLLDEMADLSGKPSLVKSWDNTELWYKKDDKFKRPKSIINMKIYTLDNDYSKSIEGRLFANLW